MKGKFILTTIFILFLLLFSPYQVSAQENVPQEVKYKAKIVEFTTGLCPQELGEGECYFFDLEIIEGEKLGQKVKSVMDEAGNPTLPHLNYKVGQIVYLVETQVADQTSYYVKEPLRVNSLLVLTIIFVVFVVIIGNIQGFSSLLGLILNFVIIIAVFIPMIISGTNPLLASVFCGVLMMIISVYLSHGLNKKSTIALFGTFIALVISLIFAQIFTKSARLTGYSTEESTFLLQLIDRPLNMQGILLASMIIGGIGILDDITVSQVSTIFELFNANPSFSWHELYKTSMKVGKDHIASMVNTLVLAYTGSSLPLVMLFMTSGATFEEIINFEFVAEEIVRTLVGSIGLVLAVPITTLIACILLTRNTSRSRQIY